MKNLKLNNEIFLKINKFLENKPNWSAYVVGGFVRDLLLNKQSKDIDIVVVSSFVESEKIGTLFTREFCKYVGVDKVNYFENFGTSNFIYDGSEIEIVGARKESYERGSRKPITEDGTIDDDLLRRDFTINAIAISLNVNSFGEVIDKFNGINDLNNWTIRTTNNDPKVTFTDDPLRILRAIRFSSKLKFKIEEETYRSIKKYANEINTISKERIVDEINKILLTQNPSVGLKLLQDTGLLKHILPELSDLDIVEERNGKFHKNNFIHTITVVDQVRNMTDSLSVLWGALLHDIGKSKTKRFDNGWTFQNHENYAAEKMIMPIMNRLKLPVNEWYDKIFIITKYHGIVKNLAIDDNSDIQITDSAIRRLVVTVGDHLNDLLLFAKCDITTKFEDKKQKYISNYEKLEARIKQICENDALINFKIPISGEEIMELLKLQPSKQVGIVKQLVKDAILDGKIKNEYYPAKMIVLNYGYENKLI